MCVMDSLKETQRDTGIGDSVACCNCKSATKSNAAMIADRPTRCLHYAACKRCWWALHTEGVQPRDPTTSHWQSAATKRPAVTPCSVSLAWHSVIRGICCSLKERQLYLRFDKLVGALCQSHITLIKANGVHSYPPPFSLLCRWWIARAPLCITWSRWI